jgi:LPS O-antigen subunit length determinant protein (WzzB/FepE family)
MTEKGMPLSSSPYQSQSSKNEPDEINLLDLLGALIRKKVLIFSTVFISAVLSIFYAFSIVPTYRATIGLQPPEKDLTFFFPELLHVVLPNVNFNNKGYKITNPAYTLNKVISEFQSYSNQEKVFLKEKFYERFVANNPKIDTKEGIVQEINRSIHESNGGGLSAKVISYEMNGLNPELASDFLNALAVLVNNKVDNDIRELIRKGIKSNIVRLSSKLNSAIITKQLERDNKIRVYKDNIEIAKNLGISGSNFDNFMRLWFSFHERSSSVFQTSGAVSRSIAVEERNKYQADISWPIWYLYGQRALEQELNLLERRDISSHYTRKIVNWDLQIKELSKIDLSAINLERVVISQPSIPPVNPINIKKMDFIVTGIALGLFIGILLAILSWFITQAKERSKLSSPELM